MVAAGDGDGYMSIRSRAWGIQVTMWLPTMRLQDSACVSSRRRVTLPLLPSFLVSLRETYTWCGFTVDAECLLFLLGWNGPCLSRGIFTPLRLPLRRRFWNEGSVHQTRRLDIAGLAPSDFPLTSAALLKVAGSHAFLLDTTRCCERGVDGEGVLVGRYSS